MRVQFEYTQDDLFESGRRFLQRSGVANIGKWKTAVACGVLTGSVVFLIFVRSPLIGLVVGAVAAIASTLIYPSVHRSTIDKRLRQIVQREMANPGPYICEVELLSEGVKVRQMNRQILYEWTMVEDIQETSDSVEILTQDGGGVIVRNRAFASPQERTMFVQSARAELSKKGNR